MAANTAEVSSGGSRHKDRSKRYSVKNVLELLGLIDGDNSDLDLSDNDDHILDENYKPSPQEPSSSEDQGDSSDDEDPIPEPTEHRRGRKRLRSAHNGSLTGTKSTGSSRTPRRQCQTDTIETDNSEDYSDEPTPGLSQTKEKRKGESKQGRGIRWKATPLMPNLTEYPQQDETDLDRHGWTPQDYFEQYIDRDLMKKISECTNAMSLSKSGDPLNMSVDEVYQFFGACILMSCIRYPAIRLYWSKSLRITAITDRFTRARFFKLRGAIKVVIDDDRMSTRTKRWTIRMFMHFIDLALANSWLLYRKDQKCSGPKTRPIRSLEFRMEVAESLLAQHHSADADLSGESEEDDSIQGVKRHVTKLPHVSVRRRANAHLPEMVGMKNAMRCRQPGCTGRTRVRCVTCKVFLCLQTERNCYFAFHT